MNKFEKLILCIKAALRGDSLTMESLHALLFAGESPSTAANAVPAEKEECSQCKREQVLNALRRRCKEIQEDDLERVEEELLAYFEEYKNRDYFTDLYSEDYYRLLDLRKDPESRVVVIGDIHCDFNSLAAILIKLSASDYDFYEKAHFVFLGDYLDRGAMLFEPLLLLMDLQRILGDRMIMLRGNHELIYYDVNAQMLQGRVVPQDSVPCLNEYCGENKAFLEAFGYFYQTLPTYVYLKVQDQNVLLTHGSIPRNIFLDAFRYDQTSGAIIFEREFLYDEERKAEKSITDDSLKTKTTTLNTNLLLIRNKILYDMIWGDPSSDEEKYQVSGRFQFGRKQFEAYAKKNNLSRVFRSHEPVEYGCKSFYDNRLFTIFSTGGSQNEQAGYGDVHPAFAIVNADGSYEVENSYIYRFTVDGAIDIVGDIYTEEVMGRKAFNKFALNEEFGCSEQDFLQLQAIFADVKKGFTPLEDVEEYVEPAPEEEIVAPVTPDSGGASDEKEEVESAASDTEEISDEEEKVESAAPDTEEVNNEEDK